MGPIGRPSKYSPELRERAVRLVFDYTSEHPSQWATIRSVAEKLGCPVEVLRRWVRQAERDAGQRPGLTTDDPHEALDDTSRGAGAEGRIARRWTSSSLAT